MPRSIKTLPSAQPMSRRRPSSPLRKNCYLCGKKPTQPSKEHVVPRHIFSPNVIENPLILTACTACNQAKKENDEYAAVVLQGTTESPDSYEAFTKTLNSAKRALSPVIVPRYLEKPGAGLVIALRKSMSDVPVLKRGGIYTRFDGGQVKLDVPRLNSAFINMAKGVIVNSSEQFYSWNNYSFRVQFDQADFPQIAHVMLGPFQFVCKNSQFAEKWEQALFVAGFNHIMESGNRSSMICFSFFDKFIVLVTMLHQEESEKLAK